jgi:hypothetical protein
VPSCRTMGTFRAVSVNSDNLLPPPPFAPLPVKAVESLKPGKGEIVLSVKAAAVNFPDLLICQVFLAPMPSSFRDLAAL